MEVWTAMCQICCSNRINIVTGRGISPRLITGLTLVLNASRLVRHLWRNFIHLSRLDPCCPVSNIAIARWICMIPGY